MACSAILELSIDLVMARPSSSHLLGRKGHLFATSSYSHSISLHSQLSLNFELQPFLSQDDHCYPIHDSGSDINSKCTDSDKHPATLAILHLAQQLH